MDPLTAFSLACGVIQVVDFSIKVLAKCKEIHDHGALAEHQEVEEITNHLTDLRMDTSLPQSSGSTQSPDDRELRELAKTCSTTAEQLVAKLQTLKIEGPHKKREAFFKTVKALREKREIHDLEKRLNRHRSVLDTKILVTLRQRSDLASIQQSHDFQTLDRGVQKLITTLSEGPKSFEELRTVIGQENEATREHISKAIQQQQEQYEAKENRKRLLESLWFDEIHSREEIIAAAHRKTFEWIFDISDHAMGPWDNFIKWLKTGQDTYWINGKAGSGKSTLMSFLCQDDRTLESLRCWSGNRGMNVLMPKFYFWSSGTQMQKSIEGLLRSLIWQVLQLLPDQDITSSAFESRDMIPAWTERRLQTTLQSILQRASGSHLLCLFIDGLDEYEGDQSNLIDFILELVKSSAIKVCLSSRPYRVFDQAFGLSARLRLQDLTYSDIQKVVVDRFQGMPQVQSIAVQRSDWLDYVTHNILERANGVFLWVTLAVKDQIRGLKNGDSPEQLRGRLHSLPDKVEGIYARMLAQIEKVYRKEASIFLQMASQTGCRSVLEFVLASQDRLEDMLSSSDPLPEREFIAKSHLACQRIVTICAGLLEVNDEREVDSHEHSNPNREHTFLWSETTSLTVDNTSSWDDALSKSEDVSLRSQRAALEPDNESDGVSSDSGAKSIRFEGEATDAEILGLDHNVTVDFIHRTARDFVQDSAQAGTFLKANTASGFCPHVSFVKVLLAKMKLGSNDRLTTDVMMENVRSAEDQSGMAQIQLCDLIDDVMSRIPPRTRRPWLTNLHWSLHWGILSWLSMHNELRFPGSQASSPSSSNDSFHPVSSQPDHPDEARKILIKRPDFLAFATYYNLRRYVQQVIHDRKELLDADTVGYLLYCAVHSRRIRIPGLPISIEGADNLSIVNDFLRQGGNPNLKDSSLTITIWWGFLLKMHEVCFIYRTVIPVNKWEEIRLAYMETTVAFVEKGADIRLICTIPNIGIPPKYSLDLNLSALAVIELCLDNQPEHSHLRDLCANKGAPYYSRCTQITWFAERVMKRLKLYDHESTAMLEIYKKLFRAGSSGGIWENEWDKYIEKLFQDRSEDVSEE